MPTHEIVGAIRREVTDNQGLSAIGKGVSTLLSQKMLMKTMTKSGALLSPLLFKKVPETSGLRLRFPSPVMKGRTIPKLPVRNLFDRIPEFRKGKPDKPRVGFFCRLRAYLPLPGGGENHGRYFGRDGLFGLFPQVPEMLRHSGAVFRQR